MRFGVHAGQQMTRRTDAVAPIVRVVADLGLTGSRYLFWG